MVTNAVRRAPFRFGLQGLAVALVVLALAACQQTTSTTTRPSTGTSATAPTPAPSAAPRKVGLLVPLTGRIAAVGTDLARATEMAVLERGGDGLTLVVRDTASSPEGAVLAARELIEVERVDIILGPLVGSHAERVAALARARNTPVLSFSSQADIAGGGLFVLGYRPGEQVERVVAFAAGRGFAQIAGLAPDNAYGRQAIASLRAAVAAAPGGELVGTAFYGNDAIDAGSKIQELRGSTDGLPPFDALLVADGGNRLRQVSQLLPRFEVDPVDVRMLGTMLWQDDRSVLEEPALRGGWYAGVADAALRDFQSRFRRAFGREPHPLAVLGYDGLLIAADGAREPMRAVARMTEPGGYQGEAGIIRLLPSGVAQHGLAIMELTAGGPVVIEPAPLRFEDLGAS